MAIYATTQDVETQLGRSANAPAETAQWQAWLDRVERGIVRRFKQDGYDLAEQVTADSPTVEDVMDVEVAAVIRKIDAQRLAGLTSITTSVDDGTITKRRELTGDSLEPTAAEWASLLPGNERRPFSIMPWFEATP